MAQEIKQALDELASATAELKNHQETRVAALEQRLDESEIKTQKALEGAGYATGSTTGAKRSGPFLGLEQKAAPHFPQREGGLTPAEADQVRLGALVAARIAPDKVMGSLSDIEQKTVLSGLQGSTGAFTLDEAVGARFIDAARNRAVVLQAGAQTFPMVAGTVRLPGWDTPPTAAWRGETGAFAEPTASFRAVVLQAKSLAASVPLSIELIEDAADSIGAVTQIVENALQRAAASEIDRAALNGAGTDHEPLGIANTSGLTTGLTSVGSLTYDDLIALHFAIVAANHSNTGFVLAPRDEKSLALLKTSTTLDYLSPPSAVAAVPRYVTGNVPTTLGGGGNESIVFAGDWSQLVIGVRPQLALRVQLDPFTKMATNGEVLVNVYTRVDVAVLDPSGFALATGVTA